MIANMGPSVYNIVQTRETLNYAISCGTITSHESDVQSLLEKFKVEDLKRRLLEKPEEFIVRSQQIVGKEGNEKVTGIAKFPNIAFKSLDQINALSIT